MMRSSPSTNETWSSSTSASLVTCLPDSRCLAISSDCNSWFWHLTTAPCSAASLNSQSSPSENPSAKGSPAIQPVSTEPGATTALSRSDGQLTRAVRVSTSEEQTSELESLMRRTHEVLCI